MLKTPIRRPSNRAVELAKPTKSQDFADPQKQMLLLETAQHVATATLAELVQLYVDWVTVDGD